ncbi:MAG TPA: TIGR04438 family Trp-rich protein [Burkholderiaceae bacterium]|nr:TIGR04438 family Trp-rich protein [Burkholderiaceae bacterium]
MPFVWIGALLIVLKWLEVGPFAQWSWWWVLLPLALAFAWFELIEPLLGLDRRKRVEDNYAKLRKQRVEAQFPGKAGSASGRRDRTHG